MKYKTSRLGLNVAFTFEDGTVYGQRTMGGRHDSSFRVQHKVNGKVVSRDTWYQGFQAKKCGDAS
jgi:hypothetical protein